MGLFDKIAVGRQASTITLGPAEAFAAIALIAVAADGYLADAEARALSTTLGRMHLFRSYSGDVMRSMMDRLLGILQRQGAGPLFDAALKSLPHDLYDTTFAVVADLVLADGALSDEEKGLLDDLYHALQLPEALAVKIIEVMLVKNKG